MTVTPADLKKARQLIPCDPAACPFGWKTCRRNAACELRGEVAAALSEKRDEGLEMAAKIAEDGYSMVEVDPYMTPRVLQELATASCCKNIADRIRALKSGEAGRG